MLGHTLLCVAILVCVFVLDVRIQFRARGKSCDMYYRDVSEPTCCELCLPARVSRQFAGAWTHLVAFEG